MLLQSIKFIISYQLLSTIYQKKKLTFGYLKLSFFCLIGYKMKDPMMWTNLVVYASMNNQSPENNSEARIKVTLMRSGTLDCGGKPLLHELEQITLSDVKIDHLEKCFTVLDYFDLYKNKIPEMSTLNSVIQSQPKIFWNCLKNLFFFFIQVCYFLFSLSLSASKPFFAT